MDVFRAYNTSVWPGQILLYLLGLGLVVIALRGALREGRWVICGGLALLWAWMGAAYHLAFFAVINPLAPVFGVVFIVQAAAWLVWAWRTSDLAFRPTGGRRALVGWLLLGYAFVGYPLLNVALGHRYPVMPTFGVPCPTTIATLGLLSWATPRVPWYVWGVPVSWSLVGTSAAFELGMREDLGLLAAALAAMAVQRKADAPARRVGDEIR